MTPTAPIAVRLTRAFALGRSSMAQQVARATVGRVRVPLGAYRLRPRELSFTRELLLSHTRLWLWRTHQQRRAGDFVILDMSSPWRARRRSWIVDLKLGAPLRLGGGGASIQLTNWRAVVRHLADQGVVCADLTPVLATGGASALLACVASAAPRPASLGY